MSKKRVIVYSDGSSGEEGDFPVAVVRNYKPEQSSSDITVVDPILDTKLTDNLYGRIMTLVEATTEPAKLKAVKDLFSREIRNWTNDCFHSAREIAEGGNSSSNLYK